MHTFFHGWRRKVGVALAVAYIVTGVGGSFAHSYQMSRHAAHLYEQAEAHNIQELNLAHLNGNKEKPFEIELLPAGPKSSVNCVIPILPGVLLANSHYVVGPTFGKGSTKIVVYYGSGSFTLLELWGWIS